jgi:hypothetical protein
MTRKTLFMRHLTPTEFKAIAFIATLVLAGMAIVLDVKEPVVWGFLSTAIGISLGQTIQSGKN